ncbi:MAG TPA: hypothetical protein VEH27_19320, partial [Methylomirabilota bacterium]|nr:hypothetical protein [Methylomirabilota bacterium]
LTQELVNSNDRAHFVRVHIDAEGRVKSAGKQASHMLTSLATANALLEVPPQRAFKTGQSVRVLIW